MAIRDLLSPRSEFFPGGAFEQANLQQRGLGLIGRGREEFGEQRLASEAQALVEDIGMLNEAQRIMALQDLGAQIGRRRPAGRFPLPTDGQVEQRQQESREREIEFLKKEASKTEMRTGGAFPRGGEPTPGAKSAWERLRQLGVDWSPGGTTVRRAGEPEPEKRQMLPVPGSSLTGKEHVTAREAAKQWSLRGVPIPDEILVELAFESGSASAAIGNLERLRALNRATEPEPASAPAPALAPLPAMPELGLGLSALEEGPPPSAAPALTFGPPGEGIIIESGTGRVITFTPEEEVVEQPTLPGGAV